jgi:carbonic anhydrase
VILGLDGATGRFLPMREGEPMPVALPHQQRRASDTTYLQAAE